MKIIIDNRENNLIKLLKAFSKEKNFNFTIEVEKLELGDIIIQNDNGEDAIIIERKTIADLAASIRDGRYKEQSYRLNGNSLHNHNIIYLIEGNINHYSDKYTKIKNSAIYTSMFSLNFYKGFSVIRSFSINETVDIILNFADKFSRENKEGFYSKKHLNNQSENFPENTYVDVAKKVKKDNITSDNIGTIILSQIPGVSVKTASIIMKNYDSLSDMMRNLEENNKCLDDLTYLTQKNVKKRISKTAILNILKYLIYSKNDDIKIIT
jgi:ERCC4-type nuclease